MFDEGFETTEIVLVSLGFLSLVLFWLPSCVVGWHLCVVVDFDGFGVVFALMWMLLMVFGGEIMELLKWLRQSTIVHGGAPMRMRLKI